MLKVFEFCIPNKSTNVPATRDWLREIKYDGYRLIAEHDELDIPQRPAPCPARS
jgi:ATP-dependent DNA ligase